MKYLIILSLYFFTFSNGYAQYGNTVKNIEDQGEVENQGEVAKAILLFYISNLVDWPVVDSIESFNIGVLGEEPGFIAELNKIAVSYTVHNKPIQIKEIDEYDNPDDIHVLFVDRKHHKDIEQILNYCQKYQILQVTDRLENKRYTVVNFVKENDTGEFGYEVNKDNLTATNLNYQDELILYGGSLKDLRELYNTTKNLLESEALKALKLSKEIDKKSNELYKKNASIDSLTTQIFDKKDTLANLLNTLNDQSAKIKEQNSIYNKTKHELTLIQAQQSKQIESIKQKEAKVQMLDSAIKVREKLISKQSNTIEQKDSTIESKNRKLLFLSLLGSSIFLLCILIFRAYFVKKRNNKKLEVLNNDLKNQKTEIKLTLDQLQQAQDQLIDSEKMAAIGVMAAGVAHEINSPLNFIKGGVFGIHAIIEENYQEDKKLTELLETVDLGVDRAATIVSSLNHFSRQSEIQNEECDINTIIENCLSILQYTLKSRIEVEKNYTKDQLICLGNEGKIHQVFLNILTNAAQAIEGEGNIWIKTGKTEDTSKAYIQIKDSGIGIKQENIKKVTTPFFTTKEVGKGTGLGLSITKKIISDHKGKLTIESEIDKGTSIMIYLPLNISVS